MNKIKYVVTLKDEEKEQLLALIKSGQTKARKLNRAHILLLADEGKSDAEIAAALHLGKSTVYRTRKRLVEGNLEYALTERQRPGAKVKLSTKDEALLIALSKSTPPAGRTCWTMQLLADRLVELGEVEHISDETVRRILKKRISSPG
jgi:transposase